MKKANQLRKQNWSAPTIMSVFIIICMIIVYSFETLGLAKKEKNLEYRYTTPEKIIKTISETTQTAPIVEKSDKSDKVLIKKLKILTEKNKEEYLEQLMKILVDGASDQYLYQNYNEEDNQFYDI